MARAARTNIPNVQVDASRRRPVPKRHWRLAAHGLVSAAALALPVPVHATAGVKEYAEPSTVNLVDWRDRGSGDSRQYEPWGNGAAGNTTTAASEPATAAQTVGVVLIDTVLPYDPGNRVKIAWVDPSGSRHTTTLTLAASPAA
jgi:hypothetical protein